MKPFLIGTNTLNGRRVWLPPDELSCHEVVIGGSGYGKSKYLEKKIRYRIGNRNGVMVFDPHGFLFEDILAFVTAHRLLDRVIIIDANDGNSSVGLNFLAPNGMDVSAQASQVMKGIAKVFGEDDGEVKPRLERWQRNVLMALIERGLTLADTLDFLSVADNEFRRNALNGVANPYIRKEWQEFDTIKNRGDKDTLIEASLNRAAKIILSDPIRRIVGQIRSTIDIGEAIEKGKIILVNLRPLVVSKECQQVLGILLVDHLVNYALRRSRQQAKRPFFVVIDEAAELTSNDLPYSLQALRKYGVFFTLCFQTLAQLQRLPGYHENVMANCRLKVVFHCNRQDSEQLVGELFEGRMRGDVVKDEINRTMLIPRETVRQVLSTSTMQSETDTVSTSSGDSAGETCGSGSSSGFGDSLSQAFLPDEGLFGSQIQSSSSTSGESAFSGYSSGSFHIRGSSHSTMRGMSQGKAVVPFYEYLRELELSSRQFFSIEEIKEKYIAWIMCQPQRHAQIKLKDGRTIPVLIDYVKETRTREKDKRRTVDFSNRKYALPAPCVDRMIEARRTDLLEESKKEAASFEKEIEDERWQ